MNGVSLTMSPDGTTSDKTLDQKLNEKSEATPTAAVGRTGGIVTKIQMNEDGTVASTSVTRREAPKPTAPVSTDPLDNAQNDVVGRVQRFNVTENDVLRDLRLGGSMTVKSAVALGWLRKTQDNGYVWAGEMAHIGNPSTPAPASQGQPETQQQQTEPADPALLKGVKGSSEQSDAIIIKLSTTSPMLVEQFITQAAKGSELDYSEISTRLQDETAGARFQQAVDEHREAGATVLRNLGVENLEAWERHVRSTDPALANRIVRDVWNKDMSSLIQAGKQYVAARAERVAAIATSKGVDAKVENGKVFFRREALGLSKYEGGGDFRTEWIDERSARAAGAVEINE